MDSARALLDSHTFLWAVQSPDKLGRQARDILENQGNAIYISAATLWELSLKWQKGKLDLRGRHPSEYFSSLTARLEGLATLPIRAEHIYETLRLEGFHKDPFDRLLVATARVEGLAVLSTDHSLRRYDVEVIWD